MFAKKKAEILGKNYLGVSWFRLLVTLTVSFLYAFTFSSLENIFGPAVVAISIIPVALVGWFFGFWGGLIAGVLTFPVNYILLELAVGNGLMTMMKAGVPGTLTVVIVGGLIGRLSDYSVNYKNELLEHKESENKLSKNLKDLENTKVAMLNVLEDSRELEEKLKAERDKISQIVTSMGEGLLVVDKNRKITMINPAAAQLLEISEKDALGREWSDTVSTLKDDQKTPTKERSFAKTLNTGKTIITYLEDNHYYLTKSGKKFPIVSTTAVIKEDGKVIGAVKAFRDATSEKQLEERLREERDRDELILSSMGEGLLVIDPDYKIVLMNRQAEKLLETTRKKAVGKKWADIIKAYEKDEEIPFEKRVSVRVLKIGKSIVTKIDDDHYYLAKSGKKFSVASITAPLYGEEKKVIGAVKVFRDATAEKEAKSIIEKKVEERTRELKKAKDKISEGWLQLQKEKARLAASINSLPLGFFIITSDHNIIYMNPAMKGILGKERDSWTFDALSNKFKKNKLEFEIFCAHCRDEVSTYGVDDAMYEGKILRIISVPIVIKEKKEVIGSAILMEDVTESKLLERTKDEFFAVASHELRTPLTAIRGNTSLIQEYFSDKIDDPDFKDMLSDMHSSSIRLINLVNDFLDISRLEQGKIKFKDETIDLVTLTSDSLGELESTAKEKNVYLKFKEPREIYSKVKGDKDRIKQVIDNLVANGIAFTEEGGVTVDIEKDTDFLKVSVTDTGVGISKKNQRLLFKKFQQAGERVLARNISRGTGMGLYISKLLTEGMGGNIYLKKSEAGKGSTFEFTLPIAGKIKKR